MKEKTTQLFNRLEEQRKELLAGYESLSPEQLAFKPEPGAWNHLQVLRHIITAERQSLAYIQRRISRGSELTKAGFNSWFRHKILQLALFLPLKFKAPKIAQVDEEYPDYESMKAEWDEVRAGYQELINMHDGEALAKTIYRHPRAGLLNMNQAIEFMETHISHHIKQIGRIKRHSLFP
ncbi:MAG: DinB family protein [Balneolaceae bacterium]